MSAFDSAWALLKAYPVIETEHGDYQCGKCSTFHDDFLDAEECCSTPLLCGYRQHNMDERAQECCPMENPPTKDVGPLGEEGQDVLALMRFREMFGEPDEESSDYFKRSWDVLKMPIVPLSLRSAFNEEDDDDTRRYEALFEDPKTGEKHRMGAVYQPNYVDDHAKTLRTFYGKPYLEAFIGDDHSSVGFYPDSRFGGHEDDFSARRVETKPAYQRRGYATALYDMAAAILAKFGKRVVPSIDQSGQGESFWASKVDFDDGDFAWPRRYDL